MNCDVGEVAFQTERIECVKSPDERRLGVFNDQVNQGALEGGGQ